MLLTVREKYLMGYIDVFSFSLVNAYLPILSETYRRDCLNFKMVIIQMS